MLVGNCTVLCQDHTAHSFALRCSTESIAYLSVTDPIPRSTLAERPGRP